MPVVVLPVVLGGDVWAGPLLRAWRMRKRTVARISSLSQ